jgi:hypothetical protein
MAGAFVTNASSALALPAKATTIAAVEASKAARVAALVKIVDRKRASIGMAASIRVTIRLVTAAEVRPARALRTPEG